MSLVKWCAGINLHKEKCYGDNEVPVIPLAALREMVEGLRLLAKRSTNVYDAELAQRLLAQIEGHMKGGGDE